MVLPAHAACAPSTWQQESSPIPPARSYRTLALALTAGGGAMPAVIVNDSIDVQVGQLARSHWHDTIGDNARCVASHP
ncbi:hypothetical protein MXD59_16365 [Frankia sp. Ag45/Mut15]|uniref:Uncharacterized protein n=1 Tax=Frankia umida TaxID=573489 RepID=A0ABT0K0T2_9ACTN|nr:hypothetical protein [Frankia umida]MCK9877330.1 hypothetical protein [Frankia umida]